MPVTTPDTSTLTIDDVDGARSRLTFFKVMAFIVGVGLLVLVVEIGWSLTKMVLVMLAGCVPFLSFWVERRVAAQVEAGLAAARQ